MEIWKEFEANELTHSSAHYLMAVHDLLNAQGYVRSADVAKELGIARSSASLGLHQLIDKGFLTEDGNKFLKLTSEGKSIAEQIIGKKVLFKRFFQDILRVKPHQAEIDTCKIEHLVSSETGARLLAFMQFMSSKDSSVKRVLEKFWSLKDICEKCPGIEACPVCDTICLKESMPTPLRAVK